MLTSGCGLNDFTKSSKMPDSSGKLEEAAAAAFLTFFRKIELAKFNLVSQYHPDRGKY